MNKQKPKTPQEWHAYRAKLSCRIAIDVIEGKSKAPGGVSAQEWAIYNLLHAVESLASMYLENNEGKK